jgi:hypothetical protein
MMTNPKWTYQDSIGRTHVGYVEHVHDFGGTDITYRFRDSATGEVSMVSGTRLKNAVRNHGEVTPVWEVQS